MRVTEAVPEDAPKLKLAWSDWVLLGAAAAILVVSGIQATGLTPRLALPGAGGGSIKSVAAPSFVNMSDQKDGDLFADGLSEQAINGLIQIPDSKVDAALARESVGAGLHDRPAGRPRTGARIISQVLNLTSPKPSAPQFTRMRIIRLQVYAVIGDKEPGLPELRAAIDAATARSSTSTPSSAWTVSPRWPRSRATPALSPWSVGSRRTMPACASNCSASGRECRASPPGRRRSGWAGV